ncbi:MAG: glycosyltransferase [Pseudomonadota bacterium]
MSEPAAVQASCCIVSYDNPPAQIERVLGSLSGSCPGMLVHLVDNSRSDRLRAVAERHGAAYRHQPHNPGFGSAHNWALREAARAGSRFHFVLNPDVQFDPAAVSELLGYMLEHDDIGMLAPRVHYPDGRLQPLCKLLPHPVELALRRFAPVLYRCSGRLARYELHGSGYDKVMEVPALSACFLLLRVETVLRVGMFDERFFLYFEDVDLSRRVQAVARTVYVPSVCIVHEYAKGSYKSWRLLGHHIVSAVRYFNKWGWWRDPERQRLNARALRAVAGVRRVRQTATL